MIENLLVRKVETEDQIKEYNFVVSRSINTSFFCNYYWLTSYSDYGVSVSCFIVYDNDTPIGGYGQLEYSIVGIKFISIPHGPFVIKQDHNLVHLILSSIKEKNTDKSFILLKPFVQNPGIESYILEYCNKFNLECSDAYPDSSINYFNILSELNFVPSKFKEPIKSLEVGQIVSLEEDSTLLSSYRDRTSRYIRATLKTPGLICKEIIDEETLLDSYKVFTSTASRIETIYRDFPNILKYWFPALQRGDMFGFVSYLDNNPVAAVICTVGGNKVAYTAGGIVKLDDLNKNIRPAHLLQFLCMKKAFQLGYTEYDLSSIVDGGVGLFKSSFKPCCFQTSSNFILINDKIKYGIVNWVFNSKLVGKYRRNLALLYKRFKK